MKKTYAHLKQYWELIVMLFIMTVLSGLCNQTSVWEWLRFWGFQVFCLFIPGIAVMLLIPMRNLRRPEKVLYSYAMGYVLTTVLYPLIMLTVGEKYLTLIFGAVAIAALVFVWYHVTHDETGDVMGEGDDRIWIGAILAVFLISLFVASMRWRLPYIGERNTYSGDYLDWVRKIATFKRDASAFMAMVKNYHYHYLGMLQQAAVAKLTNISAFGMASQYSHIEASVFVGLSSYAIVDRLIKNKKAQITALVLILFSTGFEGKVPVSYLWHLYIVPMSYQIAQSLGIMILLLILIQLDEEFDPHKLFVTVCLLMCCTGTKGATGAVIFGGIGLACLYAFFVQKRKKLAVIYCVCALAGFGVVYAYLMPTAQVFNDRAFLTFGGSNSEEIVDTAADEAADGTETVATEVVNEAADGTETIADEAVNDTAVETDTAAEDKESLLSRGIGKLAGYIRYFIYVNPWTMLPMVVLIGYSIVCRNIKKEHLLLFLLTMAGTMLGYFVHFFGHSEMYFTLTVYPFAAVLAGCLLEIIFSRGISVGGQSAVMAALCIGAVIFTVIFDCEGDFRKNLAKGLDNFWIFQDNVIDDKDGGLVLDYDEFYVYDWIRTHTEPDALILTNRLRINEEGFLFGSLTERELAAVEGYLEEDEEFAQFSDMGVDYIVFNKYLGQFDCPPDRGETVFENEQMIICELY